MSVPPERLPGQPYDAGLSAESPVTQEQQFNGLNIQLKEWIEVTGLRLRGIQNSLYGKSGALYSVDYTNFREDPQCEVFRAENKQTGEQWFWREGEPSDSASYVQLEPMRLLRGGFYGVQSYLTEFGAYNGTEYLERLNREKTVSPHFKTVDVFKKFKELLVDIKDCRPLDGGSREERERAKAEVTPIDLLSNDVVSEKAQSYFKGIDFRRERKYQRKNYTITVTHDSGWHTWSAAQTFVRQKAEARDRQGNIVATYAKFVPNFTPRTGDWLVVEEFELRGKDAVVYADRDGLTQEDIRLSGDSTQIHNRELRKGEVKVDSEKYDRALRYHNKGMDTDKDLYTGDLTFSEQKHLAELFGIPVTS